MQVLVLARMPQYSDSLRDRHTACSANRGVLTAQGSCFSTSSSDFDMAFASPRDGYPQGWLGDLRAKAVHTNLTEPVYRRQSL